MNPYGKRDRISRRRVIIGALVISVAIIGLGHIGDRLILWPTTMPEDRHGATQLMIPFEDGELEILRATASRSAPEAYVLRFYGNADRAERWVTDEAAALADRGVELWGVNYPGYGASTGPARLKSVADAALTAYDALKKIAAGRPIYVFGTSLGTTAALHVAAERNVAGLLLQNPPPLRELIFGDHGWWNLWLLAYPVSRQIPSELDSIANAKRARCPAVFLLADQDEVVRHKYHRLVTDAFAGPKEVLIQEGARHNTPMSREFGARMHAAVDRMFALRPAR
jgi:uncharacterized protein